MTDLMFYKGTGRPAPYEKQSCVLLGLCRVEEMGQQYLNRKETLHPGPGRLVVPFWGGIL